MKNQGYSDKRIAFFIVFHCFPLLLLFSEDMLEFVLNLHAETKTNEDMATKNRQTAKTPDAYKAYLMEVLVTLATRENQTGMIITDPALVAEKWGLSPSDSADGIKKASNILSAVKLFISKAVDDNWNIIK